MGPSTLNLPEYIADMAGLNRISLPTAPRYEVHLFKDHAVR